MNEPTGEPTKRPRSDARERLLKATLEIASENGVERATTRRIAEQAGVNLQLIQYHFGGKDAMIEEAQEYIVDRFFEEVGPTIEGATNLEQAIRSGITATWELALSRPEIVQPDLLLQTVRSGQREPVPESERRTQRRIADLLDVVSERTGETLSVPRERFALITVSALGGLVLEYQATGDEEAVSAAVGTLADVLVGLVEPSAQ